MSVGLEFWIGFNVFLIAALAIDLGVVHRRAHEVKFREAMVASVAWIALSLLFAGGLLVFAGQRPALEFLTGWAVEKSLSIDNLFVIALIFGWLGVPAAYQHRVLFWGVVTALVLRGGFIAAGSWALDRWGWVIYVFGGLLVVTGIKLAFRAEHAPDLERNPVVRLARRVLPLTTRYDGQHFWTKENGRRAATPLFLALVLVEATDVVFAVDSIPAVFAVTRDPFLVYTSNAFALLGLRSLYFLLADLLPRFRYLKYALAGILVFVGAKMLVVEWMHVHPALSLGVIASLLTGAIVLSLRRPLPDETPAIARATPPAPVSPGR